MAEFSREQIKGLFNQHQEKVIKAVHFKVGNLDVAEDITQEVFLKLLMGKFKHEGGLYTAAKHLAITSKRDEQIHEEAREKLAYYIREDIVGPGERVCEAEESRIVREGIEKLPEKYRHLIVRHYYEGLSIQQISEELNKKPKTVATQLSRARSLLAKSLVKLGITLPM